jgi:uncharacterized membrane protein YedE/YeeE
MSTGHGIPDPDRRDLRNFGFVTGGMFAILFGLLLPWLLDRPWPVWPWLVLGVLAGSGLILPEMLRPVYAVWMRFGLIASKVTTPIVLGIVFFLIISPMAVFRKWFGLDAMRRQFDPQMPTYRTPSSRRPAEDLEKPY